jgi:hypothetical protein
MPPKGGRCRPAGPGELHNLLPARTEDHLVERRDRPPGPLHPKNVRPPWGGLQPGGGRGGRLQGPGGSYSNKGGFTYDYLVLAPGSWTAFFIATGVRENAIDLKGLREVPQVRNTIIARFEEAQWSRGDFADGLLTFVFVGGGRRGGGPPRPLNARKTMATMSWRIRMPMAIRP